MSSYIKYSFFSLSIFIYIPFAYSELYFELSGLDLNEEQKKELEPAILENINTQIPGLYDVKIRLNDTFVDDRKIKFVLCSNTLCPELTTSLLDKWGIDLSIFPELDNLNVNQVFNDLSSYIPDATINFNFGHRILDITVPQVGLQRKARGYLNPQLWDDGLNAAYVSYYASGYELHNRLFNNNESSQYINFRSGINVGVWRLKNYSYYSRVKNSSNDFVSMQTWLERDLRDMRSRFIAGETSTPNLIYDSFNFTGVYIKSEDAMLPDSAVGYAPQIKGIAQSNAIVEIRQNANLLYQTFVPPGEFIIDDLYPTSSSGDLEILIKEQDGTIRSYTQVYASTPVSVRKGAFKYSLALGQYGHHNSHNVNKQNFLQTELIYGLFNQTSLYGGFIQGQDYQSAILGVGQSLGRLGGLSFDITKAKAELNNNQTYSDLAYSLRYSKYINSTKTGISVTSYHYGKNYYSINDASINYTSTDLFYNRVKNKIHIDINQDLNNYGGFSLSFSKQNYWNSDKKPYQIFSANWSKTFHGIGISISQSQTKNWTKNKNDTISAINVTIPLGQLLSKPTLNSIQMNNNYSYSNIGQSNLNMGVTGNTTLDNNQISYSLSQAMSKQKNESTINNTALNVTYEDSKYIAGLGYGHYYGKSSQINWMLNGSIVAHPHGITLSQPLSNNSAYAVIKTDNAKGVRIIDRSSTTTDSRGYAVIPYISPYRLNKITLDSNSLDDNYDFTGSPVKTVVPTQGAFILLDYDIHIGMRAFLTLLYKNKPIPFGTFVRSDNDSAIADEGGQIYLFGKDNSFELIATLPNQELCKAIFNANSAIKINGIFMASLECK